jgi:hypothetical protein
MNRRTKQVGVVLGLVAVVCFVVGWPVYLWLRDNRRVSPELFERTRALVERNPQLRPEWDKAMEDGVLTWREAKSIIERAGQKVDPGE